MGSLSNGVPQAYILQGHECLVFFLGGIPLQTASGYGMTGFGKDPTNPFTNNLNISSNYSNNRQAPFFEFNPGRLVLDPTNPYTRCSRPSRRFPVISIRWAIPWEAARSTSTLTSAPTVTAATIPTT